MTRLFNWLFPHPAMTLILAIVWIILQNDLSYGMAVFGLILGIIIPRMTAVWWPDRPSGFKIGKMSAYVILVLWCENKPTAQNPISVCETEDRI